MGTISYEIEKKYLVKEIPFSLDSFKHDEIEQAYISKLPTIRIRKKNDSYFLTTKGKGDIKRIEYDLEISEEEYKNLFSKIEGEIISKTRYYIPLENNLTAEFDIYHGFLNTLMTVEVEFKNDDDAKNFIAPSWFYKDISSDPKFKNSSLSDGVFPNIGV